MRACGLYPRLDVLSGLRFRPDVDGVAAPGLAYGFAVFCAPVADVDVFEATYLALVAGEGVLLDCPQDLEEAALHDLRRHHTSELCRLGALSRGELEDVGGIEGAVLHELQGLLVVCF